MPLLLTATFVGLDRTLPKPIYIITESLFITSNQGEIGFDFDRAACVAGLDGR